MWDKKEMLGNYRWVSHSSHRLQSNLINIFRVQLNVAGYEFYGQAELPQQAKHNAAVQVEASHFSSNIDKNIFFISLGATHSEKPARPHWWELSVTEC